MTLYEVFSFVFKRLTTLLLVFMFVVTATTAFAYLFPPIYEASASVLVERNRIPTMRTELAPGLEMVEVLNSEAEIATSRRVVETVVDEVAPHLRPVSDSALRRMVDDFRNFLDEAGLVKRLEPRERWIARLDRTLEAKAVPNSNVLEIAYADEEPELAARIVNAAVDAYFDHRWLVYRASGETEFFENELQQVTARLGERRQRLDSVRDELGLEAIQQERDLASRTRAELVARLAAGRQELDEALARYQRGHPQVEAARLRLESVGNEIATIEARLRGLEARTAEVDQLEMLITADEETFRHYKIKADEALLSEAGNNYLTNARPIDAASVPQSPKFSRLFIVTISIPVGVLMAFSVAFIREYFDRSLSSEREAERAVQVPCFGSVPQIGLFSRLWA